MSNETANVKIGFAVCTCIRDITYWFLIPIQTGLEKPGAGAGGPVPPPPGLQQFHLLGGTEGDPIF